MKKGDFYGIGALVSLALAVLFSIQPWHSGGDHGHENPAEGVAAPHFQLLDLDGNPLNSEELLGKTVLVNFWATWCGPCRKEIPDFIELQQKYGEKGLMIVGLSVDKVSAAEVLEWIKDKGVNYPVALATEELFRGWQEILPESQRNVIPTSYLIDREGIVRHVHLGYQPKQVWEALILPLLPEAR